MTQEDRRQSVVFFGGRRVRDLLAVGFSLFLLSFLIAGVFSQENRSPVSFLEARFTDASQVSGLSIVPASCPSSPHYDGECGTPDPSPPPSPPTSPSLDSEGCPIGYIFEDDRCIFVGCPSGYSLEDNQCVLVSCPTGYELVGGSCTFVGCPTGYVLVSGQCVFEASACTAVCSGRNLVNSCTGQLIQACAYQCSNGACVAPPPPEGTITAQPALVQSGNSSIIGWSVSYVHSCTVSGTNGDSWSSDGDGTFSEVSGAITAETTYTLTCDAFDGSTFERQVKVGIVPTFEET